jgi:hypothetical protein
VGWQADHSKARPTGGEGGIHTQDPVVWALVTGPHGRTQLPDGTIVHTEGHCALVRRGTTSALRLRCDACGRPGRSQPPR